MFFLIFIIAGVKGIIFEYALEPQQSVCFQDILPQNTLVVGDIKGYDGAQVNVIVTDQNKKLAAMSKNSDPLFSFTTEEGGEYQLCFYNERDVESVFRLKYLSGAEALDYHQIATKKDALNIEDDLIKMQKLLSSVQMQMKFNIARENNNLSFTEFISFKILGFGVVLLLSLFFINYMAIQYLKGYFQRKKII